MKDGYKKEMKSTVYLVLNTVCIKRRIPNVFSKSKRCNNKFGCPEKDDELNCDSYAPFTTKLYDLTIIGQGNNYFFVKRKYICDYYTDCPDQTDVYSCHQCQKRDQSNATGNQIKDI